MKIKQKPEDFIVEELADLALSPEGNYAVFRIEKRSMNTLDAVAELARSMGVHRSQVGFAGLKDKYSVSVQHFSVANARGRDFEGRSFRARFLGMSFTPLSSRSLKGNRFEIIIRDLSRRQAAGFAESMDWASKTGVPNYFDDQRFGSARHGQGFIARKMVEGDFEGALKLVIATPSRKDRSSIKAERALISRSWGRWSSMGDAVRHDPQRRILAYLCNRPDDFKGAMELVDPQLMSLYLNAWQSLLWNRVAILVLSRTLPSQGLLRRPFGFGEFLFPGEVDPAILEPIRDLQIPLPAPGSFEAAPVVREALETVMEQEGLSREAFHLGGSKAFFKKGSRRFFFHPVDLHVGNPQPDELDPGRRKLKVSFTLAPGSYATIMIKRASIFGT